MLALTAGMLVAIGLFKSRRVANRRLGRLTVAGKIKRIALIQVKFSGPPEYLYFHKTVSARLAQHQGELSQFLLWWFNKAELLTGDEVDQSILADAEIVQANAVKLFVEWCRGTMTYQQCEERWKKVYIGTKRMVLLVASSETRLKGFVERAKSLQLDMLVTTAQEAMERGPFAPIWVRPGKAGKRALKDVSGNGTQD